MMSMLWFFSLYWAGVRGFEGLGGEGGKLVGG